jgi:hypothetical protein
MEEINLDHGYSAKKQNLTHTAWCRASYISDENSKHKGKEPHDYWIKAVILIHNRRVQ